jgi:hypothetical protein
MDFRFEQVYEHVLAVIRTKAPGFPPAHGLPGGSGPHYTVRHVQFNTYFVHLIRSEA